VPAGEVRRYLRQVGAKYCHTGARKGWGPGSTPFGGRNGLICLETGTSTAATGGWPSPPSRAATSAGVHDQHRGPRRGAEEELICRKNVRGPGSALFGDRHRLEWLVRAERATRAAGRLLHDRAERGGAPLAAAPRAELRRLAARDGRPPTQARRALRRVPPRALRPRGSGSRGASSGSTVSDRSPATERSRCWRSRSTGGPCARSG
jgi:hypothetical protein